MGQMFDETHEEINVWRWDNPCVIGNQVDRSNREATSLGKVTRTGLRFSSYTTDVLRAMIEPPSCQQYKPGDFLAVRPLNGDEIIDEDDDDENWVHPGAPSGARSCSSDGYHNDDCEGEEDMQGGENGTRKQNSTKDGKGKGKGNAMEEGKGKGKGNGKANGIGKETPGEDDSSHAVAVQLQKEIDEADSEMVC
jgi:hypothetical protein